MSGDKFRGRLKFSRLLNASGYGVDLALFDLHGGIGAVKEGVWSLKWRASKMKAEHFKIKVLQLDAVS